LNQKMRNSMAQVARWFTGLLVSFCLLSPSVAHAGHVIDETIFGPEKVTASPQGASIEDTFSIPSQPPRSSSTFILTVINGNGSDHHSESCDHKSVIQYLECKANGVLNKIEDK